MARTPSHPIAPEPDPPAPEAPEPPAAPDMQTSAEEQRARSAAIQQMGVEDWKAAHDERTEEEKAGNRQVPGVFPQGNPEVRSANPEAKSWEGSTRSTPAARKAQNPAAPR